jgi:WD40 repeat protein
MSTAASAPPSPFKGLAPFQDTELDSLLFCGREREREVVVANLLASRLTVLYGASGVGKTSLLRAAVAHTLRRAHDAAVVLFSSWAGDPRAGFGAAIDAAVGIESSGTVTERLAAASRAVEGDVYVILDQFEEYFLYHERDAFAGELAAAIREPALRANFLLGLREDGLAKLDAFKGQIPNLFANYLRLDHLDRRGARAAILGPVERYGRLTGEEVRVEPELVEAVLDQVAAGRVDVGQAGRGGVEADEERIEAPYLQLVLERLWEVERERGSDVLRLATLRELGGAESIVRAHLERALGSLRPAEQDVAATMFEHLVTPSGSKIAHRPGDLAEYAAVPEADVVPVLDRLGRERIVRSVDGPGGGERYEIFHDVLADGVLAWRARRVLERDRETARKRQRRLAVVAALALAALAAMTAVAIYALTERSHARSAARQARARAFEATALADLPTDPQRSLADAVAAAEIAPTSRAEDVLRQALVKELLRRVLPAAGSVAVVAFAPGGGRMLAAGTDGHVRVYSAAGRLEQTMSAGTPVTAASFSPNGELLVAAGGPSASLWDAKTGGRQRTLHLPGSVTAVMFSPDARLLLTTSAPGGSILWRTATGRRVATLERRSVVTGRFSPSGRLVATLGGFKPSRVRVFATSSRRVLHVLAPGVELKGLAFSPNSRLLAATSYRGTYLWNLRTGKRLGRPLADRKPGPAALVTDVEFSPDGTLLAAGVHDGATRVWDVDSGQRELFLTGHTKAVAAVTWSPNGRFVADTSLDRTVHVWAVEGPLTGQSVADLVGHRDAVTGIAWSPDGSSLLTGSDDRTARLWDARFDQELSPLGAQRGGASTASFDSSGHRVVSAGADGTARIWDVRSGHLLHSLSQKGALNDAEFSRSGRRVVTAGSDRTVRLWEASTGAMLRTLRAGAPVLVARFSPNGAIVAAGDARGGVHLWRARDGRLLASAKQDGGVTKLAFVPDGKLLATDGHDGATLWSVPAGKRIRLLRAPGGVTAVVFSPDGSLVATAGDDGAARLWAAVSGKLSGVLRVSKAPLTDVVFSPDGRLLLATGQDVQTWDVETRSRLHMLVGQGRVSSAGFSPDGRWIVTAGPTEVGLWRRAADKPYFYLRSNDTKPAKKLLTSASFSPDGRFVLSSSDDGSVRLYRCEVCGDLRALLGLARARLSELH